CRNATDETTLSSIATRCTRECVMRIVVAVIATALFVFPLHAQETTNQSNAASADEVRELRQLVQELKAKVERLEKNAAPQPTPQSAPASEVGAGLAVSHEALVPEMKDSKP